MAYGTSKISLVCRVAVTSIRSPSYLISSESWEVVAFWPYAEEGKEHNKQQNMSRVILFIRFFYLFGRYLLWGNAEWA
jgi:hypothetical protein